MESGMVSGDLECRACNPAPEPNDVWATKARVDEIVREKDAEIRRLKRDVAGQTRSAQNGWRTAETLREQLRNVRKLADYWATLAPGDQHYAAKINEALDVSR